MNAATPSLAEARALVASPLWPRIRAFLWDFASLCDPRRLSAAAEGSTRAPRAFEDASGIVPETPSASFEGGSAAVRSEEPSVQGTPAQPALNVREADLERAADAAPGTGGFAALANALATTQRVAASALHALGVEATFHAFPSTDSSRLLLLSREDYDRLAQFLGVVAFAPALRRITAGAEVRALKAALPNYRETLAYAAYFHRFEALFERCSKRALRAFEDASGVVAKTPSASFEGGSAAVVPEDERGEAASDAREAGLERAAEAALGTPAQPASNTVAAGHAILAAALSTLPPELLLRQRLRFPEGSSADTALGNAQASPDGQAPSCPTRTTSESPSSLAGEARAAALLALKLSNPQEYQQCFS